MPDDKLTATLAEIQERCDAATPGPWWSDQDERLYRLHGVAFRIPPQADGVIPEQVVNKQIAKAPKQGTSYAEYWPDAADDAFITHARTDVPCLLAAPENVSPPPERGFAGTLTPDAETETPNPQVAPSRPQAPERVAATKVPGHPLSPPGVSLPRHPG